MSAAPIDRAMLRRWPLPQPDDSADKESRGRIVVVGGSREIAGAVLLAATAALRMGAGKLVIATGEALAGPMALHMPEARVIGLAEADDGGMAPSSAQRLAEVTHNAQAVVIGPGLAGSSSTPRFVEALLRDLTEPSLLLDAGAMNVLSVLGRFERPVLLTPHAGEMAHLSGMDKAEVEADPQAAARALAQRWNAVVALKGADTVIATPDGKLWQHSGGNAGLATSGSGDVLAGAIGGLCARGATLAQAAAWGVYLHAQAGERLCRQIGPVGLLARELPAEMLAALREASA